MRIRQINPEECLNALPKTGGEKYLYLYGRDLVNLREKREYYSRLNLRDLLCVSAIDELTDSVQGVGISVRYEAQGTEMFPGIRTLDEIGIVWVGKNMRENGIGSAIFKHILHALASKQDSKWIYFQAMHPKIKCIANNILMATSVPYEKDTHEKRTTFCLDVRDPEQRSRLVDFLNTSRLKYA